MGWNQGMSRAIRRVVLRSCVYLLACNGWSASGIQFMDHSVMFWRTGL